VDSYGGDAVRIELLNAHEEFNTNSQDLYKENRHVSADNFYRKPLRNYFVETINFCYGKKIQKNILTPKIKNYQHSYGNFSKTSPIVQTPTNLQARSPPTNFYMQGPSNDSIIIHNHHSCGQRVPQHPGLVRALR
jgi:hypothetical protein